MSENVPYKRWDLEHGDYPPKLPGERHREYRERLRGMEEAHEAAKSPQQRLRETKEFDAFMQRLDDAIDAWLDAFPMLGHEGEGA